MTEYIVNARIQRDGHAPREAGQVSDLAEFDPAFLSYALEHDIISLVAGEGPVLPEPEVEPGPVTLTHWMGQGAAPPGTWEHLWQEQVAAQEPAATEDVQPESEPRGKRKRGEE